VELSIRDDLDLKNGIDAEETSLLKGNPVCVGATPPCSIADTGIESITHRILLGPLQQNGIICHNIVNDALT
jgi:hypothetical protein